jgi:predicted phage gp36 major capsid-like protein
MNQRGSLTIGLGIAVAVLSASLSGMGWLYNNALKEKGRIEGEYEAFKMEAQRLGEVAQQENAKLLRERERKAYERIKSLAARVADATARADRLCKSAGLSAGCSALPAVPDTARPVDDSGFNQRLLEVLRHAQTVADQLAELQAWVEAQSLPR